jgi:hypothetical protein
VDAIEVTQVVSLTERCNRHAVTIRDARRRFALLHDMLHLDARRRRLRSRRYGERHADRDNVVVV